MKHYDPELKAKVTKDALEVNNSEMVAKKYNLPQRTVYNWMIAAKNKDENWKKETVKDLKIKLEKSLQEIQILKELLKKTYHLW